MGQAPAGAAGQAAWVVADGAHAEAASLKPAIGMGMTVVSRLREGAALWTVPEPRPKRRRGRPRIYGEHRIDPARRAGRRRGWTTEGFVLYGRRVRERYRTFDATWRPAGGPIRVVPVAEPTGWVASSCTDAAASVEGMLATVADRFALETAFGDGKGVVGAGRQQVRSVWANIGAFHVRPRTSTMTEAWARRRSEEESVDRRASPWDDPDRRPSHADERRARRRESPAEGIRAVLRPGVTEVEIQAAAERLLNLAA
jgi:hypothetical protein